MLFFLLATFLFQKIEIQLGKTLLQVEVAKTEKERNQGLMGRESLKDTEGMLFIYEKPQIVSFWMKKTKIPLSIGFFDEEKRLFQIEKMEPYQTFPSYKSSRAAQYALEVKQNWFEENGISIGATLSSQRLD